MRVGFELFDSRTKNSKDTLPAPGPSVTVTASHAMLINRWATEALGNPRRVLLYFDRERRAVGVRAVEAAPYSYRASPRANGKQVTVGCLAFLREHNVADGRFPAAMENGMLVFQVGPPGGRFLHG